MLRSIDRTASRWAIVLGISFICLLLILHFITIGLTEIHVVRQRLPAAAGGGIADVGKLGGVCGFHGGIAFWNMDAGPFDLPWLVDPDDPHFLFDHDGVVPPLRFRGDPDEVGKLLGWRTTRVSLGDIYGGGGYDSVGNGHAIGIKAWVVFACAFALVCIGFWRLPRRAGLRYPISLP